LNSDPLVLAVDDEPGVLRLVSLALPPLGFAVITADTPEDAIALFDERHPDIVLLDVVMPGVGGLGAMRELRARSDVPIIVVTALDSDADKVRGLDGGADDYVAKPFSWEELAARIRAVLRRCVPATGGGRTLRIGEVEVDLERRLVRRSGDLVPLTRTEWRIIQALAANPGRIVPSADILASVWGPEYRGDLQYLRVWMRRLRKKLEDDASRPRLLKNFIGLGYMLDPQLAGEPGVRRNGAGAG